MHLRTGYLNVTENKNMHCFNQEDNKKNNDFLGQDTFFAICDYGGGIPSWTEAWNNLLCTQKGLVYLYLVLVCSCISENVGVPT